MELISTKFGLEVYRRVLGLRYN